MSRRYSTFDSAFKGGDLVVQQGGITVTTGFNGLDINRTIRGTLPVTGGANRAQFIVYGLGGTSLANKVSIGLVNVGATTDVYVGGDGNSIGYRVGEGAIYTGGSSVDAAPAAGDIGCVVDVVLTFADGGEGTVAWYLRNTPEDAAELQATRALPTDLIDTPIYWAVSVGSTADAGDIIIQVNTGAKQFESDIPVSDGWWRAVPTDGAFRLSTQDYVSAPTDTIPNTRYEEGIIGESAAWDMRFRCWVHGDGDSVQGSAFQAMYSDPADRLLPLLKGAYRDKPIRLLQVEQGEALSTATDLGEFVFERVEIVDDGMYRITGRDYLVLLNSGIQSRYFRPDVDAAAANRSMPTIVGPGFSFPPVLIDAVNFVYQLDSRGAEGTGKVRDMGDPLVPVTDYTVSADGQTITLVNPPRGIVTVDCAVTGNNYAPPPAVPDEINDEGNPFTGTDGGDFDHFTRQINSAPDNGHIPVFRTGGFAEFPQIGVGDESYIEHDTFEFEAGKKYRVQFELTQIAPMSPGFINAFVGLTYNLGQFGYFLNANSTSGLGFYTAIYSPAFNHPLRLYYYGNNQLASTPARVRNLTVFEIPPIEDATEDEVDAEIAAQAMPLAPMLREVLDRAGKPESMIEIADAEALDTITGYAGQGFATVEQMPVAKVIEELLVGYTAGVYRGRGPKLRIGRLFPPTDVDDVDLAGELDENSFLSALIPTVFEAKGLTKSMGARRNEVVLDSTDTTKLVDDLVDLPLRLRAKLGRAHRIIATSGAILSPQYADADNAEPVGSRLLLEADADAEINRVCGGIFTQTYALWRTTMVDDGIIEPMLTYLVRYPRYGLSAGLKMTVHAVNLDPINQQIREVIFFALAPGEY